MLALNKTQPVLQTNKKQQVISKNDNHNQSHNKNEKKTCISQLKGKQYPFTHVDAKELSKKAAVEGQPFYSLYEFQEQIDQQLKHLGQRYNYYFYYNQQRSLSHSKKMTRIIYLKFQCYCGNAWKTIAGTFQIQFKFNKLEYRYRSLQVNYPKFLRAKCIKCERFASPLVPKVQIEAMKIFFSILVIKLLNQVPPQNLGKYYIKQMHWHKKQLCEACLLNRCITQDFRRYHQKDSRSYFYKIYKRTDESDSEEQVCFGQYKSVTQQRQEIISNQQIENKQEQLLLLQQQEDDDDDDEEQILRAYQQSIYCKKF